MPEHTRPCFVNPNNKSRCVVPGLGEKVELLYVLQPRTYHAIEVLFSFGDIPPVGQGDDIPFWYLPAGTSERRSGSWPRRSQRQFFVFHESRSEQHRHFVLVPEFLVKDKHGLPPVLLTQFCEGTGSSVRRPKVQSENRTRPEHGCQEGNSAHPAECTCREKENRDEHPLQITPMEEIYAKQVQALKRQKAENYGNPERMLNSVCRPAPGPDPS